MRSLLQSIRDLTGGSQRGFTLLELVVVLVLAAIIAVLAFPKSGSDTMLLVGQAEQVASDIRYVQSLAMTQGQKHWILFNPSSSPVTYQFVNSGGVVPNPITNTAPVSFPNYVSAALSANLSNNLIAFDGLGVPYSDTTGASPLTAQASVSLAAAGTTKIVTIEAQTGRVAVQ